MQRVIFENVSIVFPVFNLVDRSLKRRFWNLLTGEMEESKIKNDSLIHSLKQISFSISDGERVGVIGKNGAGKSTLLRTLAGVYQPVKGKVTINGQVTSLINISLGIDKEATGLENIYLRSSLLGIPKSSVQDKLCEIIEFSELGHFIDYPVRTYSSGMQFKLAFAITLLLQPEVLLMDEWLSVGDAHFKKKVEAHLETLVKSTGVLVLASHSRRLIERVCTRVLWLEGGVLKMDGRPEDVCREYWN